MKSLAIFKEMHIARHLLHQSFVIALGNNGFSHFSFFQTLEKV